VKKTKEMFRFFGFSQTICETQVSNPLSLMQSRQIFCGFLYISNKSSFFLKVLLHFFSNYDIFSLRKRLSAFAGGGALWYR